MGGPVSLVLGILGMSRDQHKTPAVIAVLVGGALTVLIAPMIYFSVISLCR